MDLTMMALVGIIKKFTSLLIELRVVPKTNYRQA